MVIGGGSAGAAIAGLLAERSGESVLLLEAGPDYGPFAGGRWPADLLDARALPATHQWGYDSGDAYPDRAVIFERARVIGGCSSHNGCAAIRGNRSDYDLWSELGNEGWSGDELRPVFEEVERRLRVRTPEADEVNPFQRACLEAAAADGVEIVDDLNDPDGESGMAPAPVNIVDGVRWNTAFAYLDPVRDAVNLTVRGGALADRLVIAGGRVTGVVVVTDGGARHTVAASRAVLASGAYGSPALLQRSGVGDPQELRSAGIEPRLDLPGVGGNLHDHPAVCLTYEGTDRLERAMRAFGERRWLSDEQTIAKLHSRHSPDAFDIHLYPYNPRDASGRWRWDFPVACMTPRSRGRVRVRSADPAVAPVIDHRYLSDDAGHDRAVLSDAVRRVREIVAREPLASLLGGELTPGSGAGADRFIDRSCAHYYHPVGTCRMGPADDREAVVDARGRVHGLDGVCVADASIMPILPRANTAVPAVVLAERIAAGLLAGTAPVAG